MIPFEKAEEIVDKHSINRGTEMLPFVDTLGRVLAEDISSDMDMPPFDKTAVDGFACRRADLDKELKILETIPAGVVGKYKIGEGECSKIMTGAAVPEGADFVFMVEDSLEDSAKVSYTGKSTKDNIAKKAEDISRGDIVLRKGRTISPQDIAVLATVGAANIEVSKKLKLGIISTGNELVEPDATPRMGQIRNSNAYQLIAQVIRSGAEAVYFGIARDSEEETYDIVSKAIDECDIVLLTGGVSMGDFDFVPGVLKKAGVDIVFDRVAVQPGKPTTFGVHKSALVFGLPGNPVSCFVQFELFVRPLIARSMKSDWTPAIRSYKMAKDYRRRRGERLAMVPVLLTANNEVEAADYHGSAHINALPDAVGLIKIPLGILEIKKGESVDVRPI